MVAKYAMSSVVCENVRNVRLSRRVSFWAMYTVRRRKSDWALKMWETRRWDVKRSTGWRWERIWAQISTGRAEVRADGGEGIGVVGGRVISKSVMQNLETICE